MGNVSIYYGLSYESKLISYAFSAYIASNLGGLTDLFLTNIKNRKLLKKLIVDNALLSLICSIVIYYFEDDKIILISLCSLILYPIYAIFYYLRSTGRYAYSAIFKVCVHIIILSIILNEINLHTDLLKILVQVHFVCSLFVLCIIIYSFRLKFIDIDFHLYKIGLINTFTGEIDRYIIALALGPTLAITYISVSTSLGLITLGLTSLMRLFINQYNEFCSLPNMRRYVVLQIIIAPFVVIALPMVGHDIISVWILSFSLLIKYISVIITIPAFVRMYASSSTRELFRISLLVNGISVIVNLLYIIIPIGVMITALAKFGSAIPLYFVWRRNNSAK